MWGSQPEEKKDLLEHVYPWDGLVVEILDDGKMWNHSVTKRNSGDHPEGDASTGGGRATVGAGGHGWGLLKPRLASGPGDGHSSYAIRDIEAGEEFLDNYALYDELSWFEAVRATPRRPLCRRRPPSQCARCAPSTAPRAAPRSAKRTIRRER